MDSEITYFAKTSFRKDDRIFGIRREDRRRHFYILGKSGTGKTNLLETLAIEDIKNGNGVCFVDAHGESADKLLDYIPRSRINDVIFFNPSDSEYPVAFNIMEGKESKTLIASGIVGIFKKIWSDSWGPRLEHILRNTILTLLDYPSSTLLGIPRLLVDEDFRRRILGKLQDPVIKEFWNKEFKGYSERLRAEAIAPIQNKVGQFLSSSTIRNIIGQPKSSFNVRDIMDNQKILILNLSKGKIGEDNSALLGAMMITRIQLSAMARADIPEEERKDFYLYVDEFQNFATESFANILSEARKYRLNLILANQYIDQIDEAIRDAVLGNCGSIASFRVGAQDAERMVKEMGTIGTFDEDDFCNLEKYHIYLRMMIDGKAGQAFSAETLPPPKVSESFKVKIIRQSRERYARKRRDVESKIFKWSE